MYQLSIEAVMAENEKLRNKCERLQNKLRAIVSVLENSEKDLDRRSPSLMGEMLFCNECDSYCEFLDGYCRRCGHQMPEDGQ